MSFARSTLKRSGNRYSIFAANGYIRIFALAERHNFPPKLTTRPGQPAESTISANVRQRSLAGAKRHSLKICSAHGKPATWLDCSLAEN